MPVLGVKVKSLRLRGSTEKVQSVVRLAIQCWIIEERYAINRVKQVALVRPFTSYAEELAKIAEVECMTKLYR